MLLGSVFLIIGLVLILAGANWLTGGASSLARRLGISDLVVGLTVVAFGTSAPELAISILSAVDGSTGLAIGNVVGSNMFNTLAIIGVTALVCPIVMRKSILTNDIPLVVLSSAALVVMANGPLLDQTPTAEIGRVDGLLLLMFFAVFMRYTFAQSRALPVSVAESDPSAAQAAEHITDIPVWRAVLMVCVGLGGLILGGNWFVDGASDIALGLGVSEAMVGLTIVSIGTSLPELATSIVAAVKGKTDMAVGNVIGSNIFNVFLVLGVTASISPLPLGDVGNVDLISLLVATVLFWLFGTFFSTRTITRAEGSLLVLCYIAYMVYLVV